MAITNQFKIESIFTAKDRLSRPVSRMGASLGRFNRKATSNMAAVSGTFEGMVSTFRTGSLLATAAVGAIGFALVDAAKVGATFEQSITNAVAKFPGEIKRGTQAFKDLEDAAKHVGKTTEFTTSQSAEAINFLAAAGFNAEQAIAALPGVVNLATASQTDLAFATDIATDSLSAFGLMSEDNAQLTKNLTRVNDVFAKTVTSSNTTMETLFETVKTGGQAFRAAGFSLETFSAIAGRLGSSALKGSAGGTAMQELALKLAKPSTLASKQLRRMGVAIKDSKGGFRDLFDILEDLDKGFKLKGVGDVDRAGNLIEIFGRRGFKAAQILLGDGIPALRKYREEMFKVEGVSEKMAATMRNTVAGSFKTLLSSIEAIKIDLFGDKRAQLKKDLDDFTTWVRVNSPIIRKELGALADVFRDIVTTAGKAFKFMHNVREEGLTGAIGLDAFLQQNQPGGKTLDEKDAALATYRKDLREAVDEEARLKLWDRPSTPSESERSMDVDGVMRNAEERMAAFDKDPFFNPQSKDGQSAIIGNGTTTKSESTTTTKIILEAAPGTKATIEGEDNPAVQMAPTGGL